MSSLKGAVGIFLKLKQTGKILARRGTNITPLYHLHSFQGLPDMRSPALDDFAKHFSLWDCISGRGNCGNIITQKRTFIDLCIFATE